MTDTFTESLITYYLEFRTALFISGFTLGAFLFSMKAVIMKVMKDDYYDTEEYQNSIFQRQSKGQEVTYYGNLRNFSKLILLSIYLSFFSALCQISLGYFVNIFTVVICACVAIASWVCVIFSIYQVGENWAKALEYAEDRAAKKWKKVNPPVKERLQQDTIDS